MPRRRSGRKIDFTHWEQSSATFNGQAAGTAAAQVFGAAHLPETLLRTRGNLICWADGNLTPPLSASIGVGLILVPEGTGSTVLWSPITDGDAPWFWYEQFTIGYEEFVVDVIDSPGITSFRSVIDSKAMRITRNQEIQAVVENVTSIGAVAVNIAINLRSLAGT